MQKTSSAGNAMLIKEKLSSGKVSKPHEVPSTMTEKDVIIISREYKETAENIPTEVDEQKGQETSKTPVSKWPRVKFLAKFWGGTVGPMSNDDDKKFPVKSVAPEFVAPIGKISGGHEHPPGNCPAVELSTTQAESTDKQKASNVVPAASGKHGHGKITEDRNNDTISEKLNVRITVKNINSKDATSATKTLPPASNHRELGRVAQQNGRENFAHHRSDTNSILPSIKGGNTVDKPHTTSTPSEIDKCSSTMNDSHTKDDDAMPLSRGKQTTMTKPMVMHLDTSETNTEIQSSSSSKFSANIKSEPEVTRLTSSDKSSKSLTRTNSSTNKRAEGERLNSDIFSKSPTSGKPVPMTSIKSLPVGASSRSNGMSENNEFGHHPDTKNVLHLVETREDNNIGIAGFNNSCYMDSSMVSLFLFDSNFRQFDTTAEHLSKESNNVREILFTRIAGPLSVDGHFLQNQSPISDFRKAMGEFDKSYLKEMQDPEEFLSVLFGDILSLDPFFVTQDEVGDHVFQTYGSPTTTSSEISVQELLDISFKNSGVTLKGMPRPWLIMKMPVTNGTHMFSKIFPNLVIDLKNVIDVSHTSNSTEMVLGAVICLRNSHFTTFVRANRQDKKSGWIYLDSFVHSQYHYLDNLDEFLTNPTACLNDPHSLLRLLVRQTYMCVYYPYP